MKENKVLYKICKLIYSSLLKILYRPTVIGKENIPEEGPVIFAGNHRHAFDPVVVMTHTKRTVHYMAKESLFKGIHGFIFKQIGLIKVYRSRNNPEAISSAVELLKKGGTLGIFPEGTRNRTEDELLKFKQSNSVIVPFAIKGGYNLFRKTLTIEFGKPVDIRDMELDDANDYIRNEVLNLLRK